MPRRGSEKGVFQKVPRAPPWRVRPLIRADLWEGDATKHFSVKKKVFSEKGGGNSVNGGFGKDLYRKGNSAKRPGPFSEPPDSEK